MTDPQQPADIPQPPSAESYGARPTASPVLTGPDAPPENVQRGVALALIALPVGIVLWDLLWTFGIVASIVAFGVAWGAMRLYRLGSNGPFSRTGAIAVLVITVATLVLAYISGYAVDVMGAYLNATGRTVADALVDGRFWGVVFGAIADPRSVPSLVLAILFGALGCLRVLVAAFRGTRTAAPAAPTQDGEPKA